MSAKDLWRSHDMTHLRLVIQKEVCHDLVACIGDKSRIMFDDLVPEKTPFERDFSGEVQYCASVENKVNFLRKQIEVSGFKVPPQMELNNMELNDLEGTLDAFEQTISELNKQGSELKKTKRELKENQVLLREIPYLLDPTIQRSNDVGNLEPRGNANNGGFFDPSSGDESAAEERMQEANDIQLGFSNITGLINANNIEALTRIIFRIVKGNVIIRTSDRHILLKDLQTGRPVDKVAFIMFYSAQRFTERLRQLCIGSGATLYDISRSNNRRTEDNKRIAGELAEVNRLLQLNREQRNNEINKLSQYADAMSNLVVKEKTVFHTMNLFKPSSTNGNNAFLIAEGWVPTEEENSFINMIAEADVLNGASVPTSVTTITGNPSRRKVITPTYIPQNRFSSNFQGISNAYGIPDYKEINPGFFYIFTFPFLFAIMFGDIAHGFINAICAIILVLLEKKLKNSKGGMNDILEILFSGRYLIVLMCCMSVVVGSFYNEVFGLGWPTFGSAFYRKPYEDNTNVFVKDKNQANIFGMDIVWMIADNSMTFINSYKMKMSVILGIAHMTLGLILKLLNYIKFKDWANLVCVWLPQILFFGSIFFYLCFLIIYKWFTYYPEECREYAPSIITTLINMFLNIGKMNRNEIIFGFTGKEGEEKLQANVQTALVIIAVIAVFWLLLAKIVYIAIKKKNMKAPAQAINQSIIDDVPEFPFNQVDSSDDSVLASSEIVVQKAEEEGPDDELHMPMGELIVQQGVGVIEFCIGCVSHTASYLRLWALSLAHSQLAEVFYQIMIEASAKASSDTSSIITGVLMGVLGCWVWLFFTLAVLCLMECLSAFLHTLRLHWVEYQDKFFGGEGVEFVPVAFEQVVSIENTSYVVRKEMEKDKVEERKMVDKELEKDRKKRREA